MTMLKRVADVIHAGKLRYASADEVAREVIEAMREPTNEMTTAAILKHDHPQFVWTLMIDAALTETETTNR